MLRCVRNAMRHRRVISWDFRAFSIPLFAVLDDFWSMISPTVVMQILDDLLPLSDAPADNDKRMFIWNRDSHPIALVSGPNQLKDFRIVIAVWLETQQRDCQRVCNKRNISRGEVKAKSDRSFSEFAGVSERELSSIIQKEQRYKDKGKARLHIDQAKTNALRALCMNGLT
jgi:hypothetical protein